MSKKSNKSTTSHKKTTASTKRTFKNTWILAGVAIVVIVAAVGYLIYLQSSKNAASLLPEISVKDAYAKYESGSFLLDVRTQEEWVEYHAPNTTLIPLDQLPARLNELPRDREIVVVCRSGNSSQQGRDIILNAGITQVPSMAGGLKAWQAAGYPTVTGQ